MKMDSICGADCAECGYREGCAGCRKTNGCPFGKQCFVAECILTGGMAGYQAFKGRLIDEINALNVAGMEKVTELYPLVGHFVNLAYPLPSGERVKLLKDDEIYLGAQVESLIAGSERCFGVVAREDFILICTYGANGAEPELVLFRHR